MATDVIQTYPHSSTQKPTLLDRVIPLNRDKLEVAAYIIVVALSIIAHLWGLGQMALHHDESIHAYMSWRFYTGKGGGFNCANGVEWSTYCYDPVYHGPSLYVMTLFSFFLFGDGDAQARLPMAFTGILLVASCWFLRPYLGKRGALLAAVLLGFSPSLLYYTRFARHDGLMVLWELWMVIGFFRYLDSGRAGFLYLLAVGMAFAIATHELYYILFFIFGLFVIIRLLSELPIPAAIKHIVILIGLVVCAIFMEINPPLPFGQGLYLGDKTFMIGVALLLGWLAMVVWDKERVLLHRLGAMWRTGRINLLVAFGLLFGIYLILYTTFFSYPLGAIDGLYTGLKYWLFTQQDYKRGDQPWYYYLMQLPIYEPLGIVCSVGVFFYFVGKAVKRLLYPFIQAMQASSQPVLSPAPETPHALSNIATSKPQAGDGDGGQQSSAANTRQRRDDSPPTGRTKKRTNKADRQQDIRTIDLPAPPPAPDPVPAPLPPTASAIAPLTAEQRSAIVNRLFPIFLVFWYFNAVVIFSWAGEKMPWLVVHMALPGNLLAAWALGRLLRTQDKPAVVPQPQPDAAEATDARTQETQPEPQQQPHDATPAPKARGFAIQRFLVPTSVLILLVAAGVAFWRLSTPAQSQEGQSHLLQGIVPLVFAFIAIYMLLTIAYEVGARVVLSLAGLTLAALMGAYMLRATWHVVYHHPDTPIEPLIYVQTSPDVPRYIDDVKELAINLTRDHRTSDDVAGGLSMPIVVDIGSNGGGLTWPVQWYLRDFQNIAWRSGESLKNAAPETFEVDLPNGERGLAPIVMIHRAGHITERTKHTLREGYVLAYGEGGVFNWWFPEGSKCSPEQQGYKRFYLNSWMPRETLVEHCGEAFADAVESGEKQLLPPWAPLFWPVQRENWNAMVDYLIYRDLPDPPTPESPELKPGSRDMEVWIRQDLAGGMGSADDATGRLRLKASQIIGAGELNNATDVGVGSDGRVYVADTNNHRVLVFDAEGTLINTIGSRGHGNEQFYEPRGIAVDGAGNIYVADTWNARIVKLDKDGTWLTTWGTGDTPLMEGDDRMVTDSGGTAEDNANNRLGFFGPRDVAVDDQGNVYIADTGNKRIVVTDDEGTYRYQWGYEGSSAGEFNEPSGVAVDESGQVYVADVWNGRVQVFPPIPSDTATGPDAVFMPIRAWDVPGWRANTYEDLSIAVGPEGRVYSTVPRRQLAFAANERGNIVVRWGGPGDNMASLNMPSGVAVGPDGDVYVIDRDRGQILRFTVPDVLHGSDL